MIAFVITYIISSLLVWLVAYWSGLAFFAWYDCWIGVYYDQKRGVMYLCLLPFFVMRF